MPVLNGLEGEQKVPRTEVGEKNTWIDIQTGKITQTDYSAY